MGRNLCALFLDGSRKYYRVGLFFPDGGGELFEVNHCPPQILFEALREALERRKLRLNDVMRTLLCVGPGNGGGLRATEMLARTLEVLQHQNAIDRCDAFELAARYIAGEFHGQECHIMVPISAKKAIICPLSSNGSLGERSNVALEAFVPPVEPFFILPTTESLALRGLILRENLHILKDILLDFWKPF
ncbi:MAG: hypothetical protein LBC42_01870 [Puniceicoccales bacterium]|jgi:hypothetical protein|nr:hypothetical protein [Puniceicoccales bacterium]